MFAFAVSFESAFGLIVNLTSTSKPAGMLSIRTNEPVDVPSTKFCTLDSIEMHGIGSN